MFIHANLSGRQPIASMPGQERLGIDELHNEAKALSALQIPAVLLFGLPATEGCPRQWRMGP